MSDQPKRDQPECDQPAPDQANAAAGPATPAATSDAPLIRTDRRPAAGRKARGAASQRKTAPALPVVTPGGAARPSHKKPVAARRAGPSRQVKPRRSRPSASGWMVFGVCGASALLVIVLLVNLSGRPDGNGEATPRKGPLRSSPEHARQTTGLPEFSPGDFSRTGVRPMDAEEKARRRERIDSFAEMGRAEEDKLHREKPQAAPSKYAK